METISVLVDTLVGITGFLKQDMTSKEILYQLLGSDTNANFSDISPATLD